jgi:diadenosine tetraphosphate (Ap4A) HIT family hydrolase
MRFVACLALLSLCAVRADVRGCVCDVASPDIAQTRGCSLCVEAEKHPAAERVILVKDNDPTKPNRWLAMPRKAYDGADPLGRMSAAERLELWNAAVAKGKEIWGDGWAVAMNGDAARRQCHAHVHVGKLLEGKESDNGSYVPGVEQLPVPSDGAGLWFHPAGNRLHVHMGEQINETVLMR